MINYWLKQHWGVGSSQKCYVCCVCQACPVPIGQHVVSLYLAKLILHHIHLDLFGTFRYEFGMILQRLCYDGKKPEWQRPCCSSLISSLYRAKDVSCVIKSVFCSLLPIVVCSRTHIKDLKIVLGKGTNPWTSCPVALRDIELEVIKVFQILPQMGQTFFVGWLF